MALSELLIPDLKNIVDQYNKDYVVGLSVDADGATLINITSKTILSRAIVKGIKRGEIFPMTQSYYLETKDKSYLVSLITNTMVEIPHGYLLFKSERYLYSEKDIDEQQYYKVDTSNGKYTELSGIGFIQNVSLDDRFIVTVSDNYDKVNVYQDMKLIRSVDIANPRETLPDDYWNINDRWVYTSFGSRSSAPGRTVIHDLKHPEYTIRLKSTFHGFGFDGDRLIGYFSDKGYELVSYKAGTDTIPIYTSKWDLKNKNIVYNVSSKGIVIQSVKIVVITDRGVSIINDDVDYQAVSIL